MSNAQIKEAEDSVREVKNWVAVFAEQHDLSDEAREVLNKKLEELAKKIAQIK